MPEFTEKQVRKIAREEALKVQKEILDEISEVKNSLARLERLLVGEMGTESEDTLKARATFAYRYARKNSDLKMTERTTKVLGWFEDMDQIEKGCDESKLDTLGKMIDAWSSTKFFLRLFGVVNISTLIGLGVLIMNFMKLIKEIG